MTNNTSTSITAPRYPAPALSSLPDDIRAKILEVQEKAGFIPNVFLGFARRPAEWRAFFAYHDALMNPESVERSSRPADRPPLGGAAPAGGQRSTRSGKRGGWIVQRRPRNDRHHHQRGQQLPVLRGGARCHFADLRKKAASGRPGSSQLPQG